MKSFHGLLPSNFIKGSVAKLRINLSKTIRNQDYFTCSTP